MQRFDKGTKTVLRCNMCGKSKDEVGLMIAGPSNICDMCVDICYQIVEDDRKGAFALISRIGPNVWTALNKIKVPSLREFRRIGGYNGRAPHNLNYLLQGMLRATELLLAEPDMQVPRRKRQARLIRKGQQTRVTWEDMQ